MEDKKLIPVFEYSKCKLKQKLIIRKIKKYQIKGDIVDGDWFVEVDNNGLFIVDEDFKEKRQGFYLLFAVVFVALCGFGLSVLLMDNGYKIIGKVVMVATVPCIIYVAKEAGKKLGI